jgi:5-methylcytosine-specific restriction endonuclease McrA
MARDFARDFYHGRPWRTVRDSYMQEGFGLCERCLSLGKYTKAEIVHHKVHLSPQNINDPKITLDKANLERVCRDCHAYYHPEVYGSAPAREPRWAFDDDGNVIPIEDFN